MYITVNIENSKKYFYGIATTNNHENVIWQESNTIFIPNKGVYFVFAKRKSSGRIHLSVKFIDCLAQTENKVVILSVERVKTKNIVIITSVERVKNNQLIDKTLSELFTGQANIIVSLPTLIGGRPEDTQRILTTVTTGITYYSNSVQLKKDDIFSVTNTFVMNIDFNVLPNDYFVYFGIKAILPSGNTNEAFVKGKLTSGSNELNKVYILIGETI